VRGGSCTKYTGRRSHAYFIIGVGGDEFPGTALSWETRLFVYENFSYDVVRLGNFGLCDGAQRR
jgi:hypothetical protein